MKFFMMILLFCGVCLGGNAWADEVNENGCAIVVRGDTLSKIARTLHSTVSDLAKRNGIRNSNSIYPNQKICREGDTPSEDTTLKPKPEETQRAPHVGVTGDAGIGGYTPYKEVGRNPLVSWKKKDVRSVSAIELDALNHIGVSGSDLEVVRKAIADGTAEQVELLPGTKFVSMSERGRGKSVKVTRNRVATWKSPEPAVMVTLSDGRKIARINSCSNWAQVEVPPKEPDPSVAIAAVTPEPEEIPEEKGVDLCGLDDHDLFGSIGRTDGNGSKTGWRYADGFACIAKKRVDGGDVKVGVGGLYGDSKGHTTTDGFQYSGDRYGWGPTAKYIDDDGWDARVGFFPWGKFSNDGQSADGNYVQTRNFDMRGVNFGVNLYQRELAGEKWFPKTQIYGSAFKLFDQDLQHSWQGNAIADTSDLKSSWLLSFGIRQFLYQASIKPWVSAEYFGEIPHTRNVTGMIGVTDEDEIFWAGIGLTRNLEKGGYARTGMIGIDVGNGVRKVRSDARHDEWVAQETSYYDEETGAFTLKRPDLGSSSTGVAKFNIATGSFEKGDVAPSQPVTRTAKAEVRQEPPRKWNPLMKSDGQQSQKAWLHTGFGDKTTLVPSKSAAVSSVQTIAVAESENISGFGGWNNR